MTAMGVGCAGVAYSGPALYPALLVPLLPQFLQCGEAEQGSHVMFLALRPWPPCCPHLFQWL